MLSRLPAVSGELITRDCRTMHGGRGCARPAPYSPRCQAGTAWRPHSERNEEVFDDLIQLAVAVRRFRPRASFEADRGFDKGNSDEREKRNMLFSRVAFAFFASRTYYSCTIVTKEHARPTCTSWGSKRKRAHGRRDRSEPCRSARLKRTILLSGFRKIKGTEKDFRTPPRPRVNIWPSK